MLSLPLWVQWTAAIVFTVVNLGTILWVLLVMWPFMRWTRRNAEESKADVRGLVELLRKKIDRPKVDEINI
jgi:hypothetical protein